MFSFPRAGGVTLHVCTDCVAAERHITKEVKDKEQDVLLRKLGLID